MSDKKAEILEVIKEHLTGRGIEESVIVGSADLSNDVGLDSLDVTELTLGLEERFNIEIPDEELEQLATVQDAVDLVAAKVAVEA